MNWKLKALAAAMMGAGLAMGGPASAQIIDGTPCEGQPNQGLGEETCEDPAATRAEGVLWTAAEQAVSIVSAVADSIGCVGAAGGNVFGGSISLSIGPVNLAFVPFPHFAADSTLGGYTYSTSERVWNEDIQNGARQYTTADVTPGTVSGAEVSQLAGQYTSDGAVAILIGDADFRHGASELDEHLIKDFYRGIAVPPTFVDAAGNPVATCTEAEFVAGLCEVDQANDHNANDPFEPVRIIRDNGLEVTTKKHFVDDFQTAEVVNNLELGFPVGKWRQTSFYREPNGPGEGHLTYTKVRIAPFGNPVCALQLDGTVSGSPDNPTFSGAINVFPLGNL